MAILPATPQTDIDNKRKSKVFPGATFSLWTVIEKVARDKWKSICSCGTERIINHSNLTSGKTKSCGCNKAKALSKAMTKHGHARNKSIDNVSPTYRTWASMFTRCYNKNSKSYENYGGRGIKVCERWKVYENFLADMGEKETKGISIERLNNDGNYEPGNCLWATPVVQARNNRRTKLNQDMVNEIRSGEITVEEVVKKTGCSKSTFIAAKTGQNWKERL